MPAELRFQAFPIAFVEELEDREGCVPFGGIAVKLNGLYGGSLRLWLGLGCRQKPFVETSPQICVGQSGICGREIRIQGDCLFEWVSRRSE